MIVATKQKWLDWRRRIASSPPYAFSISMVALFLLIRLPLLDFNLGEIPDSWEYLSDADGLLRSGLNFYLRHENQRLPTFPLLIAIGLPFFPEGLHWARFIALLCSGGSIWLATRLYAVLFPDRAGSRLVALFMLIHPLYTLVSIRPLSENVLLFFTLASFYVYYNPQMRYRPLLLGLSTGLAALSRGEGFLVFLILMAASLWQRRWRDLLLPLGAFIIVIGPYLIRNLVRFGNPFYPYGMPVLSELVTLSGAKSLQGLLYTFTAGGLRLLYILAFLPGIFWVIKGISVAAKTSGLKLLPLAFYWIGLWSLFMFWRVVVHVQRYYLFNVPFLAISLALGLSQSPNWPASKRGKICLSIGTLLLTLAYATGIKLTQTNQALYQALQIYRDFVNKSLPTLIATSLASLIPLWLASRLPRSNLYQAGTIGLILASYILITPRMLNVERFWEYRSVQDAAEYAAHLEGKVAYGVDVPAVHWYLRRNGIYLPRMWTLNAERQWAKIIEAGAGYLLWTSDIPRGVAESQSRKIFAFVKQEDYQKRLELVRRFVGPRGEQWDVVSEQSQGEGEFIALAGQGPIGQTFAVLDEATIGLYEIVVLMEKEKWAPDETVTLSLWDSPSKSHLLSTVAVSGKDISTKGSQDAWALQAFPFPELVPIEPYKRYYFEITTDAPDSNLTIYRALDNLYPAGTSYLGGVAQLEDLWFKVYGAFRGRSEIYKVRLP